MRSHDRALSNLESLPGGYNALRRMYTEFQEPMLNAAQEQFGANSFAPNSSGAGSGGGAAGTTGSASPSNTENREPLPNPWDRSANAANNNNGGGGSSAGAGARAGAGLGGGLPNLGGMLNSPAMQSMMEQMAANPGMLQNLMSSPMMQNMMQVGSAALFFLLNFANPITFFFFYSHSLEPLQRS